MRVEEQIKEYIEEIISDSPDLFIVEMSLKGNHGNQRLLVLMDGDNGVSIDQCAKISRKLGHWIEEEELIKDKYVLEVSSAGIATPLRMTRQYKKNEGRGLSVKLLSGEEMDGTLISSDDESITLEMKEKEERILLKEIDKSVVVVSFK